MLLLDRYIIRRFLTNFVILFVLIYMLATSIDLILQLDEFVQAAHAQVGKEAGLVSTLWALVQLVYNFHGPRLFQLFQYLAGLTCVGAMGFTLAQMLRHRELVAMLSSGMSLFRIGWPIIVAAFLINLLHLLNSNIMLPRLAPLLIRGHNDLADASASKFDVPLTPDSNGNLLHAASFDRATRILRNLSFMELDADGVTTRRVSADSARWDESRSGWELVGGNAMIPVRRNDNPEDWSIRSEPVDFISTDLSPRVLVVERYKEFAQMLSPSQIDELLASPGAVDLRMLARIKYSRYSVIFTNLLMLIITMPFFLLRLPANLLRQSVMCAGVALGALLGAFIGMEADIAAFPPAVSVFLPVLILIPLALAAVSWVKT